MRNERVKSLRVWMDDRLTWRDEVRSKCLAGLAICKLRRLRNVLPAPAQLPIAIQRIRETTFGLLLCGMAGMFS